MNEFTAKRIKGKEIVTFDAVDLEDAKKQLLEKGYEDFEIVWFSGPNTLRLKDRDPRTLPFRKNTNTVSEESKQ